MPAPEVAPTDVRLAALLRGVNVGGRTIAMYELRDVITRTGASQVRTVLASGNVLLDVGSERPHAEVRAELEKAVSEHFDFDAHIALVPLELIEDLAAGAPWVGDDAWHIYVAFSTEPGLLREATALTQDQLAQETAAALDLEPQAPEPTSAELPPPQATTPEPTAAPGPSSIDAPEGSRLAEVRARASSRRTLDDALAANAAAQERVTELRMRTGRTEACSVVAAAFLVGGAERDEPAGDLIESWQHPPAELAARLAAVGLDALWWRCPRGSSLTTPLAKTLARKKFASTTTRNVRTLLRLS
ncbi:DUF1697 domain-containing protein [Sanguibacter sp. A247]|uniref:DUF1697 domain-containing protein n=1 Tax=unclassified Sanguibacter TaxID=2645534 RepID=UPI003FD88234